MNKVDINEIKNALSSRNNIESIYRDLLSKVDPIIKTYHGKKITRRLETAIKKVLPEYTLYLSNNVTSTIYLKIWGNGLNYDQTFSLYFGWKEDLERFDYNKFCSNSNAYYYTTIQESKQLPEGLEDVISEWNELSDKLEALKKKIPSEYTISQFFKG